MAGRRSGARRQPPVRRAEHAALLARPRETLRRPPLRRRRHALGALDLSSVAVDVEDFLAEAAEGLQLRADGSPGSTERLEHAFALYRGDFLPEEPYADWAVSLREEARALAIEIAYALAQEAETAGRHDEAARFCLRILDRDAYDERAHLTLAGNLVAAGRHGDARRQYRAYCRRMDEIGVEPAPFPV